MNHRTDSGPVDSAAGPRASAARRARTSKRVAATATAARPEQAGRHAPASLPEQWLAYCSDALWRVAETGRTLAERADNAQAHEAAGMPPLLHFDSEPVADGRDFDPPSNYRLLRVTRCGTDGLERFIRPEAAPVVIVDPRAGHGPGIGGFRRDSEVGMAMREGHPVYFVVFDPQPLENQTLGAVVETIAGFIRLVSARHGGSDPILYGNCQGGWAVVMALSHCRRRAGLIVLNGSPMSYWAGAAGVNPMRLLGGFAGGVWPVHWLADLGGGRFDGAWLVQNFEALRPESVWRKHDALLANPQAEHDRFLEFERWWNGFYFLGREEILTVVRDLFIGNKLEKGEVVVNGYCRANLKNITTPMVIFASSGDNITPPHQALGWLRAVYSSTAEIVASGHRLVYLLDQQVGHLGIFVSGEIARRQHRAIFHHAAEIQALAPGLYEMVLGEADGEVARARFEPRALEALPYDPQPPGFEAVQCVSERLDELYSRWLSPLVRAASGGNSAQTLARWHPMRMRTAAWATRLNPAAAVVTAASSRAKPGALAQSDRDQNHWYRMERELATSVHDAMAAWRQCRDLTAELMFNQLFAAMPWFGAASDVDQPADGCDGRCEQCAMSGVCSLAGHHPQDASSQSQSSANDAAQPCERTAGAADPVSGRRRARPPRPQAATA